MKVSIVSAFALTLAVVSVSAQSAARLVYDLGHGQNSVNAQLAAFGEKLGYVVDPVSTPIQPETLRGARLLYLRVPTKAYSDEEKRSIVSFVRGGGSLLLVFEESKHVDLAAIGVNDLISPFGLALTDDTEYLHNAGAIARRGDINAAERELPFSGGRAVDGGTAFAWQLDRDGKPAQPFASYATVGGARVVVMSDGMASAFLGKPEGVRLSGVPRDPLKTVFWGKDSITFMEEVLAWLTRAESP
jgi:hypothetical protein